MFVIVLVFVVRVAGLVLYYLTQLGSRKCFVDVLVFVGVVVVVG